MTMGAANVFNFTASFQKTVSRFEALSPSKKADYERAKQAEEAQQKVTDSNSE